MKRSSTAPLKQESTFSIKSLMNQLIVIFNLPKEEFKKVELQTRITTLITTLNNTTNDTTQYVLFSAYFANKISMKTKDITFLNFLLDNKLSRALFHLNSSLFIDVCFQVDNLIYLEWLILECGLVIGKSMDNTHQIKHVALRPESDCSTHFLNHCSPSTALILAIRYNHLNFLEWLIINKKYDVNSASTKGLTPLEEAVARQNNAAIDLLLQQGALITCQLNNCPLLEYAITCCSLTIITKLINKLIEQGVSPAEIILSEGCNLAQFAILQARFMELAMLLPLIDIDPTILDSRGFNLAVYACVEGGPEGAKWLLSAHPTLDIRGTFDNGMTLLHLCINTRVFPDYRTKAIEWLVNEHHFDLEARTSNGDTPLLLAACLHDPVALDHILWRLGRSVNLEAVNHTGRHIGHYLAEHNDHELIAKLFTQKKFHCLPHRDVKGQTMLDLALAQGPSYYPTVMTCVNYVHKRNHSNRHSKFSLTTLTKLPELLHFFCKSTDSMLSPWVEDGQPPLHIACIHTDRTVVEALVRSYQLPINQLNENQETPLGYMIKQKKIDDALWFIQTFGPRVTLLDNLKSSLLQLACEEQHIDLVKWCCEQKKITFSSLKPRADGLNALDIALIKQRLDIFICLWEPLSREQRQTYIESLQQSNDIQCLDFLREHALYVVPETACRLETSNPSLPMIKTDKKEAVLRRDCSASAAPALTSIEFICNEKKLLQAIHERQMDYIKRLKHYPTYNDLLLSCVDKILSTAIDQDHYSLIYHVLRLSVIRENAHSNKNAALLQACTLGRVDVARCLLRIPKVEEHLGIDNHTIYKMAAKNQHHGIMNLLQNYPVIQRFIQDNPAYIEEAAQQNNPPIASVHDTPLKPEDCEIFSMRSNALNPLASPFKGLPLCYTNNPYFTERIDRISAILNLSDCKGYLYGSALYKIKPGDLDILLPNTRSPEDFANVRALIEAFIADGGHVTARMPDGEFGYKKPNRYVIPMDWNEIKLEFVVSPKQYTEHAQMLDFTIGARYFDLNEKTMITIAGINAYNDFFSKELNTISEPYDSFREDWSRIFRGVRLVAAEGFHFSTETEAAIKELFSEQGNLLLSEYDPSKLHYNRSKLAQQLKLLFDPDAAPNFAYNNIKVLHHLGVMEKLFESISFYQDIIARYYTGPIQNHYQMILEQEAQVTLTPCYSPRNRPTKASRQGSRSSSGRTEQGNVKNSEVRFTHNASFFQAHQGEKKAGGQAMTCSLKS